MTRKQFKEIFSVGDKITCKNFYNGDYQIIKAIGVDSFFTLNVKDKTNEIWGFSDNVWQMFYESPKQDLVEMKLMFQVGKSKNGKHVLPVFFDKRLCDYHKNNYNKDHEYITLEEAIERGLDTDLITFKNLL
jgi:hypothetical protein